LILNNHTISGYGATGHKQRFVLIALARQKDLREGRVSCAEPGGERFIFWPKRC